MDGKDLAYCRGCDHLSGKVCDYLIHVGHSRGCLPGVGCPLHTKKKPVKKTEKQEKQSTGGTVARKRPDTAPIDELRAMQLYNDGLDDVAMADALGITAKRVQNWRLRMHLKRPNAGQKKKVEKEKKSSMSQENEQAAKEVSFHQVVKQPETVDAASCRQVSEPPETQEISAETAETQGTEASKRVPERSEAIRVREMFALLEKLVQAGLGNAPTQIDGTYIKDFYAVSILRTKDGISVDLTTMK